MKNVALYCLLLLLIACSDSTNNSDPVAAAMERAARECELPIASMGWLLTRIQESRVDPQSKGYFYSFNTSFGRVIVHQPLIMSCLGCGAYTCEGVLIGERTSSEREEIIAGIQPSNILYDSFTP